MININTQAKGIPLRGHRVQKLQDSEVDQICKVKEIKFINKDEFLLSLAKLETAWGRADLEKR